MTVFHSCARLSGLCAAGSIVGFAALANPQKPNIDFQRDILPIFNAHCSPCHTGGQSAGRLSLSSMDGLQKGGISGKVLDVKNPEKSILLQRILGQDGKPRMPMGFKPLSEEDTAKIRDWIRQGAKGSSGAAAKHWAFVPPVRPLIPTLKDSKWVRNPIDAFVLARLRKEGLSPSPEADRTTLIKRLSVDLTGLPPTPAEVDDYLSDRSTGAYEKVVDRLLASPHFGERMALPWLDAARYADSNGFQQDGDTYQYVWRDWVVKAFNSNMSFREFTIEQLAGDLLPHPTPDQLVATGFNRNHMLNGEGGAIPEEQRNIILFDRVDATSTTWLGLTMACARCHDHKYDPLTQRDFYSLMAFFNNVPESGVPSGGGQYRIADPWIYIPNQAEVPQVDVLQKQLEAASTEDKKKLQTQIDKIRENWPRVMVMSDKQPRQTHILHRGNYEEPLEAVQAATPAALPRIAAAKMDRLDLARWIVSPQNPLTARVEVNRIWQMFFGRGLVRTEENFGVKGEPPTQPELLDWLAVDFRGSGWNIKRLIKQIVMSSTYRQTSKTNPTLLAKDPENRLFARASRFRMSSLILRDLALRSSGLLNPKLGGKPVYPYQPKGIWDGLAITEERDFTYPRSQGDDNHRRSIYTFWRRTVAPGNMFDASTRNVCTVRASLTSTPLHALTMLNDITWNEAARALAASVMPFKGDEARIREAFRRVCARRPKPDELAILNRALRRSRQVFQANRQAAADFLSQGDSPLGKGGDQVETAALASVCVAIYNLDEAMTRE